VRLLNKGRERERVKTLKNIPFWFKLSNYDSSENFGAIEWANEIFERMMHFGELEFADSDKDDGYKIALEYVEQIKKYPYKNYENPRGASPIADFYMSSGKRYFDKRAGVRNLSKWKAYKFLLSAKDQNKITKDFEILEKISKEEHTPSNMKMRRSIIDKYSYPYTDIIEEFDEVFLDINLRASDELLVSEFKDWLAEKRRVSKEDITLRKKFTKTDYEDWHKSRLLAYWDLKVISRNEGFSIPQHILGEALFPNELDIDTTERVRKIIQKKHEFIVSEQCMSALYAQATSESENFYWYI
jgi:hypothetical protein